MAEIIRMPRMSDTMEEGVISKWLKKVGDVVKSGEILAEVETDKATMELESYQDGTILYLGVVEKQAVPVDGVLAIIGKKGENIDDLLNQIKKEPVKKPSALESTDINKPTAKLPSSETSAIKATVITMPRMSDTMAEGTITKWNKMIGDKVKSGDVLAEVETDKATMELEAFENGTLLYTAAKEGESVRVDGVIAIIGEKNADYQKLLDDFKIKHPASGGDPGNVIKEEIRSKEMAGALVGTLKQEKSTVVKVSEGLKDGRLKASPLAKRLARDLGYELNRIKGSGENGRIVKRDVEAYADEPLRETTPKESELAEIKFPYISGEESYEEAALSQMRKTIARRLSESKFSAPHFYLTMEINMDKIVEARNSINEDSAVRISFNDFIIKACAMALRKHPKVNSSWLGDKIRYNHHIHIGVAVAIEEGLIVPVIKFADGKSLAHIANESKELGNKARKKQLQPKEWEGNTFTVSNLGMFGVEEFTAIINPPDSCILAVGGIKESPVVKNGLISIGNLMKVTLSCDHRAVDGATGAAFLQTVKNFLENPVKMLV